MSETLATFAQGLQELMSGGPPTLRPFVCDGSPIDCPIFIVGNNPAAALKVSFCDFWDDNIGFDKRAFLVAYEKQLGSLSQTRRRIELLVESAAPCKCLETNLWPEPTRRSRDLSKKGQSDEILKYLVRTIEPKIVYFHGRGALRHFRRITGELNDITEWKLQPGTLYGVRTTLYATKHLSLLSYAKAKEIGAVFKRRLT
jgi:hypothetical protein